MNPGGERRGDAALQRLGQLLAARLFVAFGVLAAALAMSAAELFPEDDRGLYATIATAFAVTIALALTLRTRLGERFGWVQIPVDIALVTALLIFTGGGESVFSFLYVPIAVYAALLYRRRAGYAAAVVASAAYGAVLVLGAGHEGPALPEALRVAMWGAQAGALLLVVLLSNALMSERDRVGRALHERTRDLESLQELHGRTVDSLTSGLVTTDIGGHITSFNPEAERITGIPAREAIGKPLLQVLPGVEVSLEEGARRAEMEFVDAAGVLHHIGLSSSTLRGTGEGADEGGGLVVIFQDVTRVVEMERALRRGERMAAVGELAARLAHEIRNPLAAISGSIEMLDDSSHGEGDRARLRGIVLRETERLDQLISDFLLYARPAPPEKQCIAVAAVVEEITSMLEASWASEARSVRVEAEISDDLVIRADESQLRQVMWNLCRNAVDAMPDGGLLRIEAFATPPQAPAQGDRNEGEATPRVVIAVSDTGVGIPDEDLDRVFEPFFTTKHAGTGLGLATVHRIVVSNGGEISVSSGPEGGTRFSLSFAAASPEEPT